MDDVNQEKTHTKKEIWPFKVSLLLSLIVFFLGGAITISTHYLIYQKLMEQKTEQAGEQAERFAELAAEAMVTMDRLAMSKVIATVIKQEKDVVMATLVNHDGTIIVHSQSDMEGHLYQPADGFIYLEDEKTQIVRRYINNLECLDFSERVDLDKRIKDQTITLGYAHIIYSLEPFKKWLKRSLINSSIIVLIAAVISFYLAWFILLTVEDRMKRFEQLVEQASEGDWAESDVVPSDETASDLVEQFTQVKSNFRHQMSKRVKNVKNEQRERLAKTIQLQLLPKVTPAMPKMDVGFIYQSGKSVSADYLDFIQLDEKHWGIVVADIAAQGVAATVSMSQVKSFLHSACQYHLSPLKTLVTINQQLYKDRTDQYLMTMNYGVLDHNKGIWTFSRAGHPGTIIYRHALKKIEYEQPKGIAMGLASSATFEQELVERKIKLQPNDCMIMYTDGIEKVLDQSMAFFKYKALKNILITHAQQPAKTIVEAIEKSIKTHHPGPYHDDYALVLLKVEESFTA